MRLKNAILFVALLLPTGCCANRDAETGVSTDSYKQALTKVQANLGEIRKDVEAVEYDHDIKAADLDLIDATSALCNDALVGKNAGAGQ